MTAYNAYIYTIFPTIVAFFIGLALACFLNKRDYESSPFKRHQGCADIAHNRCLASSLHAFVTMVSGIILAIPT